jgi:hypothetical protein
MTHRTLQVRAAWLMLAAVGVVAGCRSAPPELSPEAAAQAEAAKHIRAVSPPDMAQEAGRRPVFKWALPSAMRRPEQVTFKLFEIGQVDDPRKAEAGGKEVVLVTGLGDISPTELDPFNPPTGSNTTSDLWDRKMTQLKPQTWYHWMVRAIDGSKSTQADFYFRTETAEAPLPPPKPPAPPPALPPVPPQELPQPIAPEPSP